jgi:DNA-binding GntR family transcriptional regulator
VSGVRDHVALVRAIRERDAARAQDIMARHLGRTARRLARSARRG